MNKIFTRPLSPAETAEELDIINEPDPDTDNEIARQEAIIEGKLKLAEEAWATMTPLDKIQLLENAGWELEE